MCAKREKEAALQPLQGCWLACCVAMFSSSELFYQHLKTQQMCTVHGTRERQEHFSNIAFVFSMHTGSELAEWLGESNRHGFSTFYIWLIIAINRMTENHLPCTVKKQIQGDALTHRLVGRFSNSLVSISFNLL